MSRNASSYLISALRKVNLRPGSNVLDLGSGFGRHSVLLSEMGMFVVALDIDLERLRHVAYQTSATTSSVARVMGDGNRDLPFSNSAFALVVAVHLTWAGVVERAIPVLKKGGYLMVETFGGQGSNWRDLPRAGALRSELDGAFDMLDYRERAVGPEDAEAVAVKLLARKR